MAELDNTFFQKSLQQAGIEACNGLLIPVSLTDDDSSLYGTDAILGTIFLKGDLKGKMMIFIPPKAAKRIVGIMLESSFDENDAEVIDGIGELLNIMVGCFKSHCFKEKFTFEISVPSVRMSSVIKVDAYENVFTQLFTCKDITFKAVLGFNMVDSEEKAKQAQQAAPQIDAADLLSQIIAQNK